MSKSYEELLDYSKKIIERGDGWRALKSYLDKNCNNLEWREDIIQKVIEYENTFKIKGHQRKTAFRSNHDTFYGIFIIAIGIILQIVWLLGDKDYIIIGLMPFAMVLSGAYLLIKPKKEEQ